MIALKILDIRKMMAGFLAGGLLDSYDLEEGSVTTYCTFSIDGSYQKDFFDEPEMRSFVKWTDVKETCFSLIKGKRTPLRFHFVFFLEEEKVVPLLKASGVTPDAGLPPALCLNLRYDAAGLILTTGTSLRTFTLDRSIDHAWDTYVEELLRRCSITAEKL
jgi:hypothetical protein